MSVVARAFGSKRIPRQNYNLRIATDEQHRTDGNHATRPRTVRRHNYQCEHQKPKPRKTVTYHPNYRNLERGKAKLSKIRSTRYMNGHHRHRQRQGARYHQNHDTVRPELMSQTPNRPALVHPDKTSYGAYDGDKHIHPNLHTNTAQAKLTVKTNKKSTASNSCRKARTKQ